jgi:tetratricopeptide (TPR) repeat protein
LYLFVGAYSLSFIAFFVTSRYRMAVVPIAVFFAAVGLMGLIGRTGVTGRQRTAALVIGVVAFLLFNANLAAAGRAARADQTRFATALGLREQGKDAEALAEVRRALQYDTATNVLRLEVRLLREKGDFAGAERAARAAVRLYPRDADAYNALGGVLATAGRLDSAEVYYEAALGCDPYSIQTWKDLGNIAFARKDFAAARRYYEGALKLRPTYALAMYRLGCCYYYEGKVAEARARWQEVLRLDPTFTKAKQALEQLK